MRSEPQTTGNKHFLCLHGYGTNAAIFKTQRATIRYELGKERTYDFVQGTWPADMAPGLEGISNPETPHFGYFQVDSPSGFLQALDQLENYIVAEGPFDGIIAFSQGASLAAAHIVRSQLDGKASHFRCAVLIAPHLVYDPTAWLERRVVQPIDVQSYGPLITVRTAVVYGENDPWKDGSETVVQLCDPDKAFRITHNGGHDVPGLVVKEAVSDVVKIIRRVIVMAGSLD